MIFSETAKAITRSMVSPRQRRSLRAFLWRNDLSRLATLFRTDKHGKHFYTQHYQHHFGALRREKLNILEIGIGGFENPKAGGASLRMWKEYFPKSHIFGIDLYDKTPHDAKRIKTFRGSQTDEAFLKRVVEQIGKVDIIVDDGSHYNDHVITTFKILFPLLSPKGVYAVEDIQTSYWAEFDGDNWGGSVDLTAPHTSVNFFRSLIHGLNYQEFTRGDYTPTYFDQHIVGMHFYHNLIFIHKGVNNEGSNADKALKRERQKQREISGPETRFAPTMHNAVVSNAGKD